MRCGDVQYINTLIQGFVSIVIKRHTHPDYVNQCVCFIGQFDTMQSIVLQVDFSVADVFMFAADKTHTPTWATHMEARRVHAGFQGAPVRIFQTFLYLLAFSDS